MSCGQFDWGGRLLKSNGGAQRFVQHGLKSCSECKRINEPNSENDVSINGGAQRFPQNGWKSFAECKGIRELDCERNSSSRDESRT